MLKALEKYMSDEIPKFNSRWLSEDYQDDENERELSQSISSRRSTIYLNENLEDSVEIFDSNEILEKTFYTNLKNDIDKLLMKAWYGEQVLSQDDLAKFKKMMRYKQG